MGLGWWVLLDLLMHFVFRVYGTDGFGDSGHFRFFGSGYFWVVLRIMEDGYCTRYC